MVNDKLREKMLTMTGNAGYVAPISENSNMLDVNALGNFVGGIDSWGGDKFAGGFGITKDYEIVDYWLLRKRSKQLFTENLYARGLVRRLITNEINKGLALEATPDAEILGLDRDDLAAWFAQKLEELLS